MLPGIKSIYISAASLQELNELGKYEYFFRVYNNNEADRTTMKQTRYCRPRPELDKSEETHYPW